jgi:hypothetical protein
MTRTDGKDGPEDGETFFEMRYPEGPEITSLGRNGTIRTVGICVSATTREVELTAITSRGTCGRCILGLPGDPEWLRAFAGRIAGLAKALEQAP